MNEKKLCFPIFDVWSFSGIEHFIQMRHPSLFQGRKWLGSPVARISNTCLVVEITPMSTNNLLTNISIRKRYPIILQWRNQADIQSSFNDKIVLWSGKGCGLWLWHSVDFSLTFFFFYSLRPWIKVKDNLWNRAATIRSTEKSWRSNCINEGRVGKRLKDRCRKWISWK